MARRGNEDLSELPAHGMLPRYGSIESDVEETWETDFLGRHPWELTLREFIEQVRRYYGIEIDVTHAAIASGRFLSKDDRFFPVPVMDLDETMPIALLRFLCGLYRIPPEDFRVDQEEDD